MAIFQVIARKEKELNALAAKIEDEQALGGKLAKQTKELYVSCFMILFVTSFGPHFDQIILVGNCSFYV